MDEGALRTPPPLSGALRTQPPFSEDALRTQVPFSEDALRTPVLLLKTLSLLAEYLEDEELLEDKPAATEK